MGQLGVEVGDYNGRNIHYCEGMEFVYVFFERGGGVWLYPKPQSTCLRCCLTTLGRLPQKTIRSHLE